MFQFIPVHEGNIFAIRVSGKLSHDDYQQFIPKLEELIKPDEIISLLIELDDFHGASLAAIKDEFSIGIKHPDAFARVAIVGDKKWQKWMAFISSPFIKSKTKYFNRSELQLAWDWLRVKSLSNDELADRPIIPYEKIMVGVDYSPHSKHAVRRAVELEKQNDSRLLLVNIVNEAELYDFYSEPSGMGFFMTEYSLAEMESIGAMLRSLTDKSKKQMADLIDSLGLDQKQGIVLQGRPKATLISYAAAQDVDLIVMGTHGLRGIDIVLGSSTRYVQSHARCEVLSVPLVNS